MNRNIYIPILVVLFTGVFWLGMYKLAKHYIGRHHAERTYTTSTAVEPPATLSTENYEVKFNKLTVTKEIIDTNEDVNEKAEDGTVFVILNLTCKNTDTESHPLLNGTLVLLSNGLRYKYEKAEYIQGIGWGAYTSAVNPLMSVTKNIIYKLPDNVSGECYYIPALANDDELIHVGSIRPLNK